MEIHIDGLSKRFVSHWVFRNLSFHIPSYAHLAITGPNGAGKSTLTKIISGALHASEGSLTYLKNGANLPFEKLPSEIAFAAPYVEMIEEMTLPEAFRFHQRFRVFHPEVISFGAFLQALQFDFQTDQQIQLMSSGMKQRLRLAFALYTEASLLLLDEPTSNLDENGIQWFHDTLRTFGQNKTICIASNVEADLVGCSERLALERRNN